MNKLTDRQALLFTHLTQLVQKGKAFSFDEAMAYMRCSENAVRYHLHSLRDAKLIECASVRIGNRYDYVVKVIGLGETARSGVDTRLIERSAKMSEMLASWQKRTGWSINQIAAALSALGNDVVQAYQVAKLLAGGTMLTEFLQAVSKLVYSYHRPGTFEQWQEMISRNALRRKLEERDEILRRVEEVEQEREARRRALLAAERRPRQIQQLDYLDKAMIAALSGQVMGRGRARKDGR